MNDNDIIDCKTYNCGSRYLETSATPVKISELPMFCFCTLARIWQNVNFLPL